MCRFVNFRSDTWANASVPNPNVDTTKQIHRIIAFVDNIILARISWLYIDSSSLSVSPDTSPKKWTDGSVRAETRRDETRRDETWRDDQSTTWWPVGHKVRTQMLGLPNFPKPSCCQVESTGPHCHSLSDLRRFVGHGSHNIGILWWLELSNEDTRQNTFTIEGASSLGFSGNCDQNL